MIPTGKCPKCEQVMHHVVIEALPIHQGFQSQLNGVSYQCPHCKAVLSVGVDPLALKTDTINAIKKLLGR